MKHSIVDGILIIDDVFTKDELILIDKELDMLRPKMKNHIYNGSGGSVERVVLDQFYKGRREDSTILPLIPKKIFSEETIEITKNIHDLSYQLLKMKCRYDTLYTRIDNGILKHIDFSFDGSIHEWNGRSLSYIWYTGKNVIGGELVVDETVIEPKYNRMVVLPSYRTHFVRPCKSKNRYSVHGNILFR